MKKTRVVVVIVNWNKSAFLKKLLDKLKELRSCPFETVVVDNNSTDESLQVIAEHPLRVHLVRNRVNKGGSGGFVDGVRYAIQNFEEDYIWLLDNDAMINENTLFYLIKAMEAKADAGIVGSKIMAPDIPGVVMERGGYVDWNLFTWLPCYEELRTETIAEESVLEVTYVAACSMLVKREVFEEVGVFDREFFLHWDDIEFCMRARLCGYKVYCADRSIIYHGVSKEFRPSLLYYDIRNGLFTFERFLRKNRNFLSLFNILNKIFKIGTYFFVQKKPRYVLTVKDALIDYFRNKGGAYKNVEKYVDYVNCDETSWEIIEKNSRVAVFADPIFGIGEEIINELKRRGIEKYDLILDKSLAPLMRGERDGGVYFYDFRKGSLVDALKFSQSLLAKQYDFCICEPEAVNPFNFFFKRVYFYCPGNGKLFLSRINIKKVYLVYLTVILACSFSCIFYPFTLLKALFAKKQLM